jgi:hypothetical protein
MTFRAKVGSKLIEEEDEGGKKRCRKMMLVFLPIRRLKRKQRGRRQRCCSPPDRLLLANAIAVLDVPRLDRHAGGERTCDVDVFARLCLLLDPISTDCKPC